MEQKMTVEEVLKICRQTLENISMPVAFTESIGVPVANVCKNLQACIDAIEKGKEAEDGREADSE